VALLAILLEDLCHLTVVSRYRGAGLAESAGEDAVADDRNRQRQEKPAATLMARPRAFHLPFHLFECSGLRRLYQPGTPGVSAIRPSAGELAEPRT
jgi:hypothetical protein